MGLQVAARSNRSLAQDLAQRYEMEQHEEGGAFVDLKGSRTFGKRDASGAIYYYLPVGQVSDFHVIDCEEYWAFAAGATLELWCVSPKGELSVRLLGVEDGADPLVCVPAGTVFAARHAHCVCCTAAVGGTSEPTKGDRRQDAEGAGAAEDAEDAQDVEEAESMGGAEDTQDVEDAEGSEETEDAGGTFLSCITVPRFRYEGWRLIGREELARLCPAALNFYC